MGEFRKKPVVIKAIRCSDAIRAFRSDWKALPDWFVAAYDKGGVVGTDKFISLPTLEGTMRAYPDDWIICGVAGEVYPCKPDIFEATYSPVDEFSEPKQPPQWMAQFSERENKEIAFCKEYARNYAHGATGHNTMLVLAKMAALLDQAETDQFNKEIPGD